MSVATKTKRIDRKTYKYYNYDNVYSRNSAYNFIVGGRGIGKTYGAKKIAIRNAIKYGEQFIYLRRFYTELKVKTTFFADIMHEFPDYEFRVDGEQALLRRKGSESWDRIGLFMSLSRAQSYKSMSLPMVTLIIYDEFILDSGFTRYITDEARVFNDFYSTVDRWQDKTRVLFLANAVSVTNPYFLEYRINPPNSEWQTLYNGFITVHYPDSTEFMNEAGETRFGQFILKTQPQYADYSMGNKFMDDTGFMEEKKPSNADYRFTIETPNGCISVWYREGRYYCQRRRPKHETIVTTDPRMVREGVTCIGPGHMVRRFLKTAYSSGNVWFDSPETRNAFLQLWKV